MRSNSAKLGARRDQPSLNRRAPEQYLGAVEIFEGKHRGDSDGWQKYCRMRVKCRRGGRGKTLHLLRREKKTK